MMSYPPAPWNLTAHAYVGTFLIAAKDLDEAAPPGTKPVRLFGRSIVGTAFFVYEEPSPLTYNEIMATMLVRQGWRVCVTVTKIWVDSEASRDGGRALWAIPKELAEFEIRPASSYVAAAIGRFTVGRCRALPFALPLRFTVAQDRAGSLLTTGVRGRGRIGLARARWHFDANGPLGYLAGRKPLLTVRLKPLRIAFGV